MKPIVQEVTTEAGRRALSAVADEIRNARRRAEEQLPDPGAGGHRFSERRARARAAVSNGVTRVRETWIGTRWYARSHRRLLFSVAAGLALVVLASVAVARSRRDE